MNYNRYLSELSKLKKREVINKFFNNSKEFYNILVTSSSLEEGLDYPYIRLIIYINYYHSFISFI